MSSRESPAQKWLNSRAGKFYVPIWFLFLDSDQMKDIKMEIDLLLMDLKRYDIVLNVDNTDMIEFWKNVELNQEVPKGYDFHKEFDVIQGFNIPIEDYIDQAISVLKDNGCEPKNGDVINIGSKDHNVIILRDLDGSFRCGTDYLPEMITRFPPLYFTKSGGQKCDGNGFICTLDLSFFGQQIFDGLLQCCTYIESFVSHCGINIMIKIVTKEKKPSTIEGLFSLLQKLTLYSEPLTPSRNLGKYFTGEMSMLVYY